MINHYFHPRWRRRITVVLLLVLIIPTLIAIAVSRQQQQQLSSALADAGAALQQHRQAADAIRARQQAFVNAPQQETVDLKGLALLSQALSRDIALLSLEMAPDEQKMRLTVLSETLEGLLDFVTRLQHLPARVSLEHHQPENTMPEPWKIRAQFTLEYSDAS